MLFSSPCEFDFQEASDHPSRLEIMLRLPPFFVAEQIRRFFVDKLLPAKLGGYLQALLGSLLDDERAFAGIIEVPDTSESYLFGGISGELGHPTCVDNAQVLLRRNHDAASVAHIDGDERVLLAGKTAALRAER